MAVSIVDYLNSKGQNSSYSARKKLATDYGIQNYSGTAAQNIKLLRLLQNGSGTPTASATAPAPTQQVAQPVTQPVTQKSYTDKNPTELTGHYKTRMLETDDDAPDPYESAYEGRIGSILDAIYNRKAFNIKDDTNYQQLYDNYAERYRANADRAMRDTMASANAATGGYGSTYAQAVGQQAYDRTMEGLNDQNMALMQLAYNMYSDDRANDYNKLNAFQGQDQIEYGRYRDGVADWQNDRNYYANQYQNSFSNDYNEYQNALGQAMQLAQAGLPVPDYLTNVIDRYNVANGLGTAGSAQQTLANLASAAVANAGRSGSGSGSRTKTTGTRDYASNLDGNAAYASGSRNNVNIIGDQLKGKTDSEKMQIIDNAVESGKISESQADEIIKYEGIDLEKENARRLLSTSSVMANPLTYNPALLKIALKK